MIACIALAPFLRRKMKRYTDGPLDLDETTDMEKPALPAGQWRVS